MAQIRAPKTKRARVNLRHRCRTAGCRTCSERHRVAPTRGPTMASSVTDLRAGVRGTSTRTALPRRMLHRQHELCLRTHQRAVRTRVGTCDARPGDLLLVLISLSLVGARYLQYSVTKGEQGLNAFLMKEKSQNPSTANFRPEADAGGAKWLPDLPDLKLPSLPALPDLPLSRCTTGRAPTRRPESANDERSRLYAASTPRSRPRTTRRRAGSRSR